MISAETVHRQICALPKLKRARRQCDFLLCHYLSPSEKAPPRNLKTLRGKRCPLMLTEFVQPALASPTCPISWNRAGAKRRLIHAVPNKAENNPPQSNSREPGGIIAQLEQKILSTLPVHYSTVTNSLERTMHAKFALEQRVRSRTLRVSSLSVFLERVPLISSQPTRTLPPPTHTRAPRRSLGPGLPGRMRPNPVVSASTLCSATDKARLEPCSACCPASG